MSKLGQLCERIKWRVQTWFLPREQCTECHQADGDHTWDCAARYPGSDDQFAQWNGNESVMCFRCQDWFDRSDVRLIDDKWICPQCTKGTEP